MQQLRDAKDRGDISEFKMLEIADKSRFKMFQVNISGDRWIPWMEYLQVWNDYLV